VEGGGAAGMPPQALHRKRRRAKHVVERVGGRVREHCA